MTNNDLETQYFAVREVLENGKSQTQTAIEFSTSRRSVGRWLEKYRKNIKDSPFLIELVNELNLLIDFGTKLRDILDFHRHDWDLVIEEIHNAFYYTTDDPYPRKEVHDSLEKTLEDPDKITVGDLYLTMKTFVGAQSIQDDMEDYDWLNENEHFGHDDDEECVDESDVEYKTTITTSSITVVRIDGDEVDQVVISRGNPQFFEAWKVVQRMSNPDDQYAMKKIYDLGNIQNYVKKFTQGALEIDGESGIVKYKGFTISDKMCKRIIDEVFSQNDEDLQGRIVSFFERVMENPDPRSVECLYDFLQHADIKINNDGTFRAFKNVRRNMTDCFTGTIDNSVGAEPEMPRHLIDTNPERACGQGLHVCSEGYLGSYPGEVTVACNVDPKNVVSVPYDHNCEKMRTCGYTVVEVL